ncbi:hypothetical protein FB451DRAFT_1225444 [Mycena latifolia]|nr:hypothetical protein FB451DRAFT_1225444 [Mycena latifolia]
MARPLREAVQHRSAVTRSKKGRFDPPSRSDSPTDNMGLGAPTTPLPLSITSRLAPEFYDHFLDEFHSSRSTLSTCSSVCKQWLQICRHHLFFSVNLRPDFQDEFNDIILFMITLEHVRKIHMETWSWSYLAPPATTSLLGGQGNVFQTLTVLDLRFIHFPSFSVLRTLASQFIRLQELSFDNVTWDSPDDDGPEDDTSQPERSPPFLSRFQKLMVCACSNKPIISWLSNAAAEEGTPIVAPIRSLNLPEILPHEASLVGRFLNLELGFLAHNYEDAPAIQDAVGEIDLSLHTRLRTIRLHQLSLYQFPSTPPTPGSQSPLAEISPYLWLVPFLSRQLDLIDWNDLVKVIVNPLFSKLELVHFHVRGIQAEMDDEVRGWISHRLRDWDGAQECLQVSFE